MEDSGQVDPESKIRLVVPNSSCGGIIGKGGAIIRSVSFFKFLYILYHFRSVLNRVCSSQ